MDQIKFENLTSYDVTLYFYNEKLFTGIVKRGNYTYYFKNGLKHREDGPAVDSLIFKNYYLNGKYINVATKKEFLNFLRKEKLKIFE